MLNFKALNHPVGESRKDILSSVHSSDSCDVTISHVHYNNFNQLVNFQNFSWELEIVLHKQF